MNETITRSARRQRDLFLEAIESPDQESRTAFLAASCGNEPELRHAIEKMVEDHFAADKFMTGPAVRELSELEQPEVVGPYKLSRRLGEGGCGVVYLAEQKEPIRRQVALKIVKAGMDTASVVARFQAERQALALMDHPNIAKVLDAGATPNGRPYFVMQLVEGLPITEHCRTHHCSQPERLRLFLQVCDAVQHAHLKGIIHRDLKPSNILVTQRAEGAVAQVIDFGIAKAIQGRLTDKTVFTSFEQFIGTPAYMSPEQALVTSDDIDTRSDIYSLGVLLYELLSGKPPFNNQELLTAGLDEMRRIIREVEPRRPSLAKSAESTRARVDPDLDWIVMKCLEKDRSRRYQTANTLAEEVRRFLRGEPINARPPSAAYRMEKFVHRHRVQVAAALFSVAVLVVATVISASQAIRARQERARAEQRLNQVLKLMETAYRRVSPGISDIIGTTTVRAEMMESTKGIIDQMRQEKNPSPEVRSLLAAYYLQLSYIRGWLGYAGGMGQFREGLEAAQEAIRLAHPVSSAAMTEEQMATTMWAEMSACFGALGLLRYDEALEHVARMAQLSEDLKGSTKQWVAQDGRMLGVWARQLRAWILLETGRAKEALDEGVGATLPAMRQAAAGNQQTPLWDLDSELELLGLARLDLGDYDRAAECRRERLANIEAARMRWPNHAGWLANLVHARADMGESLIIEGKIEEADKLFLKARDLVNTLQLAEPANAGVLMLQVRILRVKASGYIHLANNSRADPAVQRSRLTTAEKLLAEAETRISESRNEQLKEYVRYGVNRVRVRLRNAEESLVRSKE